MKQYYQPLSPLFRAGRFLALLLLLVLNEQVLAQSNPSSIRGQVTDVSNGAVPIIQVYLKGTSHGTTTDSSGYYQLNNLKSGRYTLVVQGINYQNQTQSIVLAEGQSLTVNVVLRSDTRQLSEVVIKAKTKAEELRESAKAVDLIETKEIKLKSVDLSEVLAQTKGVNVRRSGGLGSEARFSLNGLTDDQIRFFMDEVPLAFSGYSFGFANVPVNLVERVEIYKGVVPIRFGADALGGAVNIVTPPITAGTHGAVSYQAGSFATNRLAFSGQYAGKAGMFARIAGFWDYAKNNYKVDVQAADDKGRLQDVTVPRFHDAYRAKGINAEIGVRNKPWAREFAVKVFGSDFFKELQNNNVMTIPYGGVVYGEKTTGISARYKQNLGKKIGLDFVTGYSFSETRFTDTSSYVFDWYGNQVTKRTKPGEINNASDQFLWEKSTYARLNGEYLLTDKHTLRVSSAPTLVTRTGAETRLTDPTGRDPLTAQRDLFSWVNGLEYEANGQTGRFQNFLFVKQYIQQQRSEEPLAGGSFRQRDRNSTYYGAGDGVRYRLSDLIRLKASYEWATRLPSPDEIFGDGALVLSNLYLEPERSHNGNLEAAFTGQLPNRSKWNATVNGFVRAVDNLIVLLGTDKLFGYQNVFSANSIGVELSAGWTATNNRLAINGNATWQDFRNASGSGNFGTYKGDRIPNTPYQMANANASYRLPNPFGKSDNLTLFWNARYVHSFYRGWESAGLKEYKQMVPSQFVNNVGATYQLPTNKLNNALTAEIQNLANANVYDNFGVQKPGRAFYIKLTSQF